MKKLLSGTRCQLLVTAISIAVISGVLGLAAYLTDVTDPLSRTYEMKYGHEFGIDISSETIIKDTENIEIIPGETAAFDPYLLNEGNYDVYVFIEVILPDTSFSLNEVNTAWQRLTSVTDRTVYYYGTSAELTSLKAMDKKENGTYTYTTTPPLCNGVQLDANTTLKQGDYTVQAIGYAVQSSAVDPSSAAPEQIWEMVGGTL